MDAVHKLPDVWVTDVSHNFSNLGRQEPCQQLAIASVVNKSVGQDGDGSPSDKFLIKVGGRNQLLV